MALTLVAISAVSAVGLAWVQDLTHERILAEIRQDTLEAIEAVLPAFDNAPDTDLLVISGVSYYPGKQEGQLVGLAVPVHSKEGYGGGIDALVGLNPAGEVTGVRILTHAETPGLGAKFTEPGYLGQFIGKSLASARWQVKKDGGDFDQITGATITPRALLKAMGGGLEAYKRDREQVLAALAKAAPPQAGKDQP
jgi:electron transport complex protein RnfG